MNTPPDTSPAGPVLKSTFPGRIFFVMRFFVMGFPVIRCFVMDDFKNIFWAILSKLSNFRELTEPAELEILFNKVSKILILLICWDTVVV